VCFQTSGREGSRGGGNARCRDSRKVGIKGAGKGRWVGGASSRGITLGGGRGGAI